MENFRGNADGVFYFKLNLKCHWKLGNLRVSLQYYKVQYKALKDNTKLY